MPGISIPVPETTLFEEQNENFFVAHLDNGYCVIAFKENANLGPSSSGKMNAVTKTERGFMSIGNGLSANVWVGKKAR